MKAQVLFFGATADATGLRESEFEFIKGESVPTLVERLSQKFPRLAAHKLLIAVNEEYADADTILKDGDEVAIFTAVSGG